MSERCTVRGGRLKQAKRECLDREIWRLFWHCHPLGGVPEEVRHQKLETDRYLWVIYNAQNSVPNNFLEAVSITESQLHGKKKFTSLIQLI